MYKSLNDHKVRLTIEPPPRLRNTASEFSGELVTFHMRFLLRWPQVAVADLGILGAEGKKA